MSCDFPYSIIGFDLDGTLLDTQADLGAALNHALARGGRPAVPVENVRNLIGGGARLMLLRALEQSGGTETVDVAALYRELLEYYEAHIAVHTRPYPGCLAALDDLATRGVTLAVATNKAEFLAVRLLDELGLSDRFAAVIGGDTLGRERAKPRPDMLHEMIARCGGGRAAFVGDTTFDTGAARAARLPSVALSFGFNDCPPHEMGADAVIEHYNQLVPTLLALATKSRYET